MSFTGVTFANQTFTPISDAVLYRSAFTDGILKGCVFDYSGATLTLTAGWLIIAGREIQVPTAQNFAADQATSGYARLLLTVDLTRAASTQVFDQVTATIEYSNTLGGFASLTQQDINASGTVYQVVGAIMPLRIGGIAGIVSSLRHATHDLRVYDAQIAVTDWASDATDVNFPYRAAISVAGVESWMPPDVYYSREQISDGNLSPTPESYDGGVYLYAAALPAAALTIPLICFRR